jgi:hypothetical protein
MSFLFHGNKHQSILSPLSFLCPIHLTRFIPLYFSFSFLPFIKDLLQFLESNVIHHHSLLFSSNLTAMFFLLISSWGLWVFFLEVQCFFPHMMIIFSWKFKVYCWVLGVFKKINQPLINCKNQKEKNWKHQAERKHQLNWFRNHKTHSSLVWFWFHKLKSYKLERT